MFALALIALAAAPDAGASPSDARGEADAVKACLKSAAGKPLEASCAVKTAGGWASVDTGASEAERLESAKAFLNVQAAAWNKGDLDGFCASYAEDATFISPSGLTKGRDQVLARYKKRYPDKAAMGTLSFEFLDARVAAGSVSVVARWTLIYPGKPAASGTTLVVLKPRGSAWAVVQDASM